MLHQLLDDNEEFDYYIEQHFDYSPEEQEYDTYCEWSKELLERDDEYDLEVFL